MSFPETSDRRYLATELLTVSFIVVFLWQIYLSLNFGQSASNNFVMKYAFLETKFFAGEYYRILTSIFLHGGIVHLFSNSVIFFLAGKSLEKKIGPLKLFILFMLSAFAGSLLTALILDLGVPAIGASGGVFGVLAAASLLVPTSSYLENIPLLEKFSVPVVRVLFSIAIIGVYFVFQETVMASLQVYQMVDSNVGHLAHFGGIMTGVTLSFLGYPEESKHSLKYSIVLTGLLLAIFMLPNFTRVWYGLIVVLVLFLVFWRKNRDKMGGIGF